MAAPVEPLSRSPSILSPAWQRALDRCDGELRKGGINGASINKELWSIESRDDLFRHIQSLAPTGKESSSSWLSMVHRLEPILLNLNDFAAVISRAIGIDGRVATLIWGSMRLIVKFAQPVLPEIIDMLEELQLALPCFREYQNEIHMSATLKDALSDTYTDILVFCAQSITFFRNNPNVGRSRSVWPQFSSNFSKVIDDLRIHSRQVDKAAEMIRLAREMYPSETIKVIQDLQVMKASDAKMPCYMIPYSLNVRFFGRSLELRTLKCSLDPKEGTQDPRIVAIHGLGGIGKTQLALHYANTSLETYDVIACIPADNRSKFTQALLTLSDNLRLPKSEGAQDDYESVQKVRDWLNTTTNSILLIFDNVEETDILDQIWPSSNSGSIIITTRSPAVASRRANTLMNLECFTAEAGLDALYKLTRKTPGDDTEAAAATELSYLLGGLPLAIVQVSEFILEQGHTFEEFLKLYKKAAEKIHAILEVPVDYNYTISTVWNISLQKLSEESTDLLNLLSFLNPDVIPEWILTNPNANVVDDRLEFLYDEFDFCETVINLTRSALAVRNPRLKALSIHRLVKMVVFWQLQPDDKVFYFGTTFRMLFCSLPDTWKQRGPQQGHGFASWETTQAILPHVYALMELAHKYKLKATDAELFAELHFRCGTYLWEREQPILAQKFINNGLGLQQDHQGLNSAQAFRLLGHIALDRARPKAALAAYRKALTAREKLEKADSPAIADIYDSIACSYTEIGNVAAAFDYLSKAVDIHTAYDPNCMSRTQAIYALTYLRDSQYDQSLAALTECWRLQGLTEDDIAKSTYPKHSGDIMLLARIRFGQGLRQDAQQLVSRALAMRRGLLGDRGPRVADSLFWLAQLLRADNKPTLAAKLYREIVEMGQSMEEMHGHSARAFWFLAGLELELNAAKKLRDEATRERDKILDRETGDENTDDAFMGLVGWMLW